MGDMSDILSGSSAPSTDVGASDSYDGSGVGSGSPVVPATPATPGPALIQRSQASPSDPNTLQGGMAPEAEPSAAGNQSHGVNWKALLTGALVGLAGSAGQRGRQNFGSGLAAGAKADLDFNQQQTANDQRQQELTQQKTFQDAQSAYHVAALSQQGKQLELQTAEYQDKHDESVQNAVKFNTDNGYAQYDVIPRTSAAAMQYIKQASANSPDGAAIPPGVLMTSTDIYVPKTGTNSFQQQLDYMKKVAPAINMPAPTDDQWQRLTPTQKNAAYGRVQSAAMGLDPNTQENYTAAQLPGVITTMQASVDKFSKVPDHDPALLTQLQNTLGLLQAQQKSVNDNAASAEAGKKAAELSAESSPEAIAGKAAQTRADELAKQNTPQGRATLAKTVQETINAKYNNADKGAQTMWASGVNPATGEKLNLGNSPDEMMIDPNTHLPIPTKMLTTLKPTMQESNRGDFARSALHTLDQIDRLKAAGKLPNGPLNGLATQAISKLGLASESDQNAMDFLSLGKSAAVAAHVGGRFNVPIMQKMDALLSMNMNDSQFQGAEDAIRNVMTQYASQGGRETVGQYKQGLIGTTVSVKGQNVKVTGFDNNGNVQGVPVQQ